MSQIDGLQNIWNLSLGEVQEFLSAQDKDLYGLSETDSYISAFKLSKNSLSSQEIKIVEDTLFENLMNKYENIPRNKRLTYVLQIYNREKSNQKNKGEENNNQRKIEKNPICKNNNLIEYN